jgi:uncharacterized protein (TIGR03437 family)
LLTVPAVKLVTLLLLAGTASYANQGLQYSHILPFLGSLDSTMITAVTSDAAGNVYLAGSTENPAFPSTPGVVQPTLHDGSCQASAGSPFNPPPQFPCPDAFVIKLDAQGGIVFATLLGGGGYDQATSIASDGAGNIYIAGITTSGNFPTPVAQPFASFGPTFIAKLNPAGTTLLYLAVIPGTGTSPLLAPFQPNVPEPSTTISMTVDAAGNAYFAASSSPGFPVVGTPLQANGPMVLGKLDPSGSKLLYGTYFGGTGGDKPTGIAIDASGHAYITGITTSTDFPATPGALQTTLPSGVSNSFVIQLNPTGTGLVYATYLGANSFNYALGIRIDAAGNAYVLGSLNSTGFPITPGAYQSNYQVLSGFLAKLNTNGTALVYSTFVATDALPPVLFDVDSAGNAYFAAQTGPGFPVSADALQPCMAGGGNDAVIVELAPDGSFTAATYLGGSKIEHALGLAVAPGGSVVLAGATESIDFPVTPGSPQNPSGYFVAKFRLSDPSNAGLPCLKLALENGVSFEEGPVAPGELVTLRGLNLGPATGAGFSVDATGRIAAQLAGVQVFFDGVPAPLLYAQAQQINAQVPWELAGQTVTSVHVEFNGASTETGKPAVAPSAPAFFRANYAAPQGAILNEDGTLNSAASPAKAGSVVSIYGTGGGVTAPASVTGGFTPLTPLVRLTLPVSVKIEGSLDAEVLFAGAAPGLFSGIIQINFRIPSATPPSASHTVVLQIGSADTDPRVPVTLATE